MANQFELHADEVTQKWLDKKLTAVWEQGGTTKTKIRFDLTIIMASFARHVVIEYTPPPICKDSFQCWMVDGHLGLPTIESVVREVLNMRNEWVSGMPRRYVDATAILAMSSRDS